MIFLTSAAATFFCTYEFTKHVLGSLVSQEYTVFVHMLAASAGEVVRLELNNYYM